MMHYNELASGWSHPAADADPLRLAAAAYLARFKGSSRDHASWEASTRAPRWRRPCPERAQAGRARAVPAGPGFAAAQATGHYACGLAEDFVR